MKTPQNVADKHRLLLQALYDDSQKFHPFFVLILIAFIKQDTYVKILYYFISCCIHILNSISK